MDIKYFQLLANGKHRKTRIYQLEDDTRIIEGDNDLQKYIMTYYKGLFGSPRDSNLQLDESFWADIPQVSDAENEILTQQFTEEEIKEAINQMEHNKAPVPDGFTAEFYQVFCELIKHDLMILFSRFSQMKFVTIQSQFWYYNFATKV
jgi:hypothetical protein